MINKIWFFCLKTIRILCWSHRYVFRATCNQLVVRLKSYLLNKIYSIFSEIYFNCCSIENVRFCVNKNQNFWYSDYSITIWTMRIHFGLLILPTIFIAELWAKVELCFFFINNFFQLSSSCRVRLIYECKKFYVIFMIQKQLK